MHDAPPGAASGGDDGPPLQALQQLLRELPGLVGDRVRLLSLEMRRAGQALALIVALLTVAAVLASTAWLAIWASIFAALVHAGLAWGWAAAAIVALNLGAAYFAVRRAVALGPLLALPATVRRLTSNDPQDTGPPEAPGRAADPAPHAASAGGDTPRDAERPS